MEKYWPAAQAKARQTYRDIRRSHHPVDADQLESDALDWVIDNVRRLTEVDQLEVRLKDTGGYMQMELGRLNQRRKKRLREENADLDKTGQSDRTAEAVEHFLEEYPEVTGRTLTILLEMVYRRKGEGINDRLTDRQRREWYEEVRPYLRRWATAAGLTEVQE